MIPGVAFGVLALSFLTAFGLALYYRLKAQKSFCGWIVLCVKRFHTSRTR